MNKKYQQFIPIVTVLAVLLIPQNWWRIELIYNPIDSTSLQKNDVIVYTTRWCPYCTKARRFLQAANIAFTEFDIEKSASAYQQYQRIGGVGVPVIQIGPKVVQGFDPHAMRQAINTLITAQQ